MRGNIESKAIEEFKSQFPRINWIEQEKNAADCRLAIYAKVKRYQRYSFRSERAESESTDYSISIKIQINLEQVMLYYELVQAEILIKESVKFQSRNLIR